MLADPDKRFVQMLVGAFNAAVKEQHNQKSEAVRSKLLLDYGRELMGVPEQSDAALLWAGFYIGFGKGCEFMTIEQ